MKHKITGLLITAGFSSRMGEFKPLMKYKGKSFLQNIIAKMELICDEIVVVTGYNKDVLEKHLQFIFNKKHVRVVYNKDYKDGMFASLQCGLATISSYDWILYHFIDQPTIDKNFYFEIISEIDGNTNWVQPEYNGKKGHPIVFNCDVGKLILNAKKESNLKEIASSSKIKKRIWACSYPQIHDDIDTIEEYKKLIG